MKKQWNEIITDWAIENNLTYLPTSKEELLALEDLDLCDFKLTTLPKEIGFLENLVYLNLSYNNFTTLPNEITNLKKLEFFCAVKNPNLTLSKEQEKWIEPFATCMTYCRDDLDKASVVYPLDVEIDIPLDDNVPY